MPLQYFLNYLLTYRKRSALSQEEVAYLLGSRSGAKVCRYERFFREPGLQTALAYEVIFDRSVSELFPALFEKAQMEVRARAKKLEAKASGVNSTRLAARKREALASILSREVKGELRPR